MNITFQLQGVTPLLMHNPQLADPKFEVSRKMKEITSKRNKTDKDFQELEDWEWFGGLYLDTEGALILPVSHIKKCLMVTGTISKLGKAIYRAVQFENVNVPLQYKGSKDMDKLCKSPAHRSRLCVGVRRNKVMRVRPQFFPWALEARAIFIEDIGINLDELQKTFELAGRIEGVGDGRAVGYGRFLGVIKAS